MKTQILEFLFFYINLIVTSREDFWHSLDQLDELLDFSSFSHFLKFFAKGSLKNWFLDFETHFHYQIKWYHGGLTRLSQIGDPIYASKICCFGETRRCWARKIQSSELKETALIQTWFSEATLIRVQMLNFQQDWTEKKSGPGSS